MANLADRLNALRDEFASCLARHCSDILELVYVPSPLDENSSTDVRFDDGESLSHFAILGNLGHTVICLRHVTTSDYVENRNTRDLYIPFPLDVDGKVHDGEPVPAIDDYLHIAAKGGALLLSEGIYRNDPARIVDLDSGEHFFMRWSTNPAVIWSKVVYELSGLEVKQDRKCRTDAFPSSIAACASLLQSHCDGRLPVVTP
jgi:hypothetical protein